MSDTLQSPNWNFKRAGVLAFGAMIEAKDNIKGIVSTALPSIFALVLEPNFNISISTCIVLQKAAEYIPDIILEHPNAQDFLNILMEGLKLHYYVKLTLN